MPETAARPTNFSAAVCHRAVDARDERFDGVFFVGITTTGIYCRPICPSRRADPDHRRFFRSAASAERDGFRPCLRCRPELAPGRALVDAVSRLATAAARRIAEGALNGRTVGSLADELCVSERHLRRSLKREVGASPVELAQTHRLLLAKRLLADTTLDMSRVAFASGFQSLRRFNAVVRERYGRTPTDLRRTSAPGGNGVGSAEDGAGRGRPGEYRGEHGSAPVPEPLRLTLAYRAPLAWDPLTRFLRRRATPGVEVARNGRYARTVRIEHRSGVVSVEDVTGEDGVAVEISPSLLPVLMPLLARLRRLLDLDAEPAVVDSHLAEGGLDSLVRRRPGLRLPGAFDGFAVAMTALLRDTPVGRGPDDTDVALAARVASALGERIDGRVPDLDRLAPGPERVADAGAGRLAKLGVPGARAKALESLARAVAEGELRLEPGGDLADTHRALGEIGVDERLATTIVTRALAWPDAFPASDPVLQRAAGASDAAELRARAESWRPWRAYAALHLRMHARAD